MIWLQADSIMHGWMKGENTMITCCPKGLAARRNDGTRPVIFKIERMDVE